MATITIRDLADSGKEVLRVQAAKSGVSLEVYARELLQAAARKPDSAARTDLLGLSRTVFGGGKGVDLELPSRRSSRPMAGFNP